MSLARFWSTFQLLHLSQPAGQRVLYRTVRGRQIGSVLEVNVGDGSRCARLIGWLRQQGGDGPTRYAAIDAFEMGGAGSIGLKAFHQQLTRLGVRPLPVPGTLQQGLPRVAHTLGAVDLAILDVSAEELEIPATAALLQRVVRPDTLVLTRGAAERSLQVAPAERFTAAVPAAKAA